MAYANHRKQSTAAAGIQQGLQSSCTNLARCGWARQAGRVDVRERKANRPVQGHF